MAARITIRKPVVDGIVRAGEVRPVIDCVATNAEDQPPEIWAQHCQIDIQVVIDQPARSPFLPGRPRARLLGMALLIALALGAGAAAGTLFRARSNPTPRAASLVAEFNPKSGTVMSCCYEGWAGLAFTVGEEPIAVTHLGRWMLPGNQRSHTVRIIHAGTHVPLTGAAVTVDLAGRTPNQFQYAGLPSPVTLEPNTAYYVVSSERVVPDEPNQDNFYGHDAAVRTGDGMRVRKPVFWNKGRWEEVDSAGTMYGPLDFKYMPVSSR